MDTDFTRRSPENHSDTLAERLRRLRQQAGLSQAELARRSGVSRSHICGIEQGVSASPSALVRLAAALEVPEQALLQTACRPRRKGGRKLRKHAGPLGAAFGHRPPPPPSPCPLHVAFREALFYRLGAGLLDRLKGQRRPALFWEAVRSLARLMNGAEQMLALHFLCKGADLEDLHPHRLGFPRAILEEPGRRWVALVKSLEGSWLVLFAQVWVETLPGRLRRLDYLACLAWKGRASFLDVEVDGPSHRGREQADRARQGQVALPTVRVPVRALGRVDFPSWLLGECVSAVTFLEQS